MSISTNQEARQFKAVINACFHEIEGFTEDLCKLFPMEKVTSFTINDTEFTVTFSEATKTTLTKGPTKSYEGAIFKIPKVLKGKFYNDQHKLEFSNTDHALTVKKGILPSIALKGVEYKPATETFHLSTVKMIKISRDRLSNFLQVARFN